MKGIRGLDRDEDGVSIVVAAIMLMAVAMMMMGNFFVNIAPIYGEEEEQLHMYDVHNRMVGLSNTINTLRWANDREIELVVGIRMGTPGKAYEGIGMAYADLEMNPLCSSCQINTSEPPLERERTRGNLVFTSHNMYYPDQRVVYENGAVLVSQGGQSSFISDPDLTASVGTTGVNVTFNSISLTGAYSSVGGANTRVVHASLVSRNFETNDWVGQGLNLEFNVTTDYRDAWSDFFTQTLLSEGFSQVGAGVSPSAVGEFVVRLTTYGVWMEIADVEHYNNIQGVIEIELE